MVSCTDRKLSRRRRRLVLTDSVAAVGVAAVAAVAAVGTILVVSMRTEFPLALATTIYITHGVNVNQKTLPRKTTRKTPVGYVPNAP
jgi:hypothetical protein